MFDAPTESVTTLLVVHEGVGKKSKLKLKWGVGLYKVFYPLHSFYLEVGGGLIVRGGLILGSLRYVQTWCEGTAQRLILIEMKSLFSLFSFFFFYFRF